MNPEKLWTDLAEDLLHVLSSYRARVSEVNVQQKADHTLLTDADLAIEALIINKIRDWDSDAKVVAEESGTGSWRPGEGDEPERIWVIDPIDGTAEFVRSGSVEFCSVVCLLEHREPVAALIVAPELGTGRTPVVVFASRADGKITINGRPAIRNSDLEPAQSASVTRSANTTARSYESEMVDMGYKLKTRTTSQTLDLLRTALDITDVANGSPRFDLFYRPHQKIWDGLAGLCLGEISGLLSTDLDAHNRLPVSRETLAQPEPTFASTVMGRPEAVKWFVKLAQDSRTEVPKSS